MDILIGSHGSGKSTLLKEINKVRPDIYTSDGFSRPIQESSKVLGLDRLKQQCLLNELTYWRWKEDINKQNCLFGRSIIDSIVYSQALFASSIDVNKYFELLTETYSKVNCFFYIPLEFALESDGVRFDDEKLQKDIDDRMKAIITNIQLPIIEVKGSVEERVKTILKYL